LISRSTAHRTTKAVGTAKINNFMPVFTEKSRNDPTSAGPLSRIRQPSALTFDQGRIVSLKLWALAMSAFCLPQQTAGEIVPQTALLFQPTD
jgi:hypothetical protein